MKEDQKPLIASERHKEDDALSKSKIEVIKNLIFGENIQAYEAEFDTIRQDILSKKKSLEDLIEAVQVDLKMALDDVATDINIRITELEDKLGERLENLEQDTLSKEELGNLLIELGKRVRK